MRKHREGDIVEQVIERVLTTAQKRLDEDLTLDDLARIARFSKFHFARAFRRVTGTSPRRFLYAMRLQEAKRLLVTTSLGVAAVSNRVGYHSVGTFTTRFTASVGVSPSVYRSLRGHLLPVFRRVQPDRTVGGMVRGRVEMARCFNERPEEGRHGPRQAAVSIGLFQDPMPHGRPERCDLLEGTREWSFCHVPSGEWYVLAVSQAQSRDEPDSSGTPLVSVAGPVRIGPGEPVADVTVSLRPMRSVDPPLVVGLVRPTV